MKIVFVRLINVYIVYIIGEKERSKSQWMTLYFIFCVLLFQHSLYKHKLHIKQLKNESTSSTLCFIFRWIFRWTSPENGRVMENWHGTNAGSPSPAIRRGPVIFTNPTAHLLRRARGRRGLRRRLRGPTQNPPCAQILELGILLRGDFPSAGVHVSGYEGWPELARVQDSGEEWGVLQRHFWVGRWPEIERAIGVPLDGEFVVGAEFGRDKPSPAGDRRWRGTVWFCFKAEVLLVTAKTPSEKLNWKPNCFCSYFNCFANWHLCPLWLLYLQSSWWYCERGIKQLVWMRWSAFIS